MEENDRAGYGAAASTALALGEGLANAAGAFTGVNGIIEGVSGQELWTGNQLSTMDRWTRGLGGVGTLLTAGVGVGELADVAQEGLRVFSCGVPEAFADDGLAGAADRMLENAGDFVSGSGVNCFTAGTQVVVGLVVVGNDGAQQEIRSQLELDLATSPAGGVATAVKVCGYLTKAIETIESGQCLVSRDEDDASAPLVFRRIEDRFGNTAYGLIHVTLLSSGGIQHTISTTVEHPIFVPGRGWIRVSELSAGDALEDICGLSTVLACQTATQLSGVGVFNLRVNRSRTYFVREPHCNAEPLWVHNTCGGSVPPTAVDGEGAGIAAEDTGRYSGRYADGQKAYRTNVPRDANNNPIPDPEATGAHSRLQPDARDPSRTYSATEFDENGQAVKRVDFAGRKGDTLPHQHPYDPNTKGFGSKEPLDNGG
jgi:hypothetical protein